MNIIKYLTYDNIFNGLCTTITYISYIPSYILSKRRGISPDDINNTIEKLKNIQLNIKNRIDQIDTNMNEFLYKSKEAYKIGNKKTALYNLKLKKMYEREKEKLDSINFNIETQIFSIESMDLIIVTAETLKDTSLHMKSMNSTLDIDKIESTMEELQDHNSINEELQNIFSESVSLDFDEDELLEELETLKDIEDPTSNNEDIKPISEDIKPISEDIKPISEDNKLQTEDEKLKVLELKQKLPIAPNDNNSTNKPSDPPDNICLSVENKNLKKVIAN